MSHSTSSGELTRAGVAGEGGGVRRDEIEDGGRNQSAGEGEREMLLDRLLLIRGRLAPYHYVMRNPFSFAQICSEFFLFSLASIIRAGNQISLWLFYGSLANIQPPTHTPHAADAGDSDLSWPFVNLCPPTIHTTAAAALWNNSVVAQPEPANN